MPQPAATLLENEEEITLDLDEPSTEKNDTDDKGKVTPAPQNKTEDKDEETGGPGDYGLSDSKPPKKADDSDDEDGFKKRYSESSTEAKRLKKELDDVIALIQSDDELFAKFKEKAAGYTPSAKTDDTAVSELKAQVEELKGIITDSSSHRNDEVITSFETKVKQQTGRTITPSMRKEMSGTVKQLTAAKIPLEKALRLSWLETYGDTITADAAKTGEQRALIKSKAADDAAESGKSGGTRPKKSNTITLTAEEVKQARRMGVKTKEELIRFAKKLQEVRSSKE